MKKLDPLAVVLVLVGALNWGLVGIAKFDLVAALFGLDFGETNVWTRIIYTLVGVGALIRIATLSTSRSPRTRAVAVHS